MSVLYITFIGSPVSSGSTFRLSTEFTNGPHNEIDVFEISVHHQTRKADGQRLERPVSPSARPCVSAQVARDLRDEDITFDV